MPKLSELSAAATLTGTEQVPVVQGGATVRTTVASIVAYGGGGSTPANGAKVITDYYNAADGSDWGNARTAAHTAAGSGGKVVYPPRTGGYGFTAPWIPAAGMERQIVEGSHSPMYDWDNSAATQNAWVALAGFTGAGMIHISNPTNGRGCTIRNLAFVGLGDTTATLNGIDFGPASGGERSWMVEECQFMQFGAAALAGHMWVVDLRDSHISRCGYGIRSASGAAGAACAVFDNRWTGGMIYFTYHHAIAFDNTGTYQAGQIDISDMRIERAGTTVGTTVDPNTNRDQDAYAIYANNVTALQLGGISTDACAGGALKFDATSQGKVNNVIGSTLILKRDGTGDNATDTRASVFCRATDYVDLGYKVTYGDPNDGGAGRTAPWRGFATAANNWLQLRGSVQMETTGNGGPGNTQALAYSAIAGGAVNFQSYAQDPRYNAGAQFAL